MAGIPFFTHLGLDHFIGADAGEVRLKGKPLPGIIQSLHIGSALRVDAARMVSGATRAQPLGYDAPTVRLRLALPSEPAGFLSIAGQVADAAAGKSASPADNDNTCYGKAQALDALHRAVDLDGNPVVYRLTNVHAQARGVSEVWFTRLDTGEAHDDVIMATLEFTQIETASFEEQKGVAQEQAIQAEVDALNLADGDTP